MRVGKRIEYVKTMWKSFTPDLYIASDTQQKDFYTLVCTKGGINKVLARLYKINDGWYIWHESAGYREKVTNSKVGIDILEKEYKHCVV